MEIWRFINQCINNQQVVRLATIVDSDEITWRGAMMAIADDAAIGRGWPEAQETAATTEHLSSIRQDGLFYMKINGISCQIWSQTIYDALRKVVIFGGGHVGQALAKIMDTLDYDITIIDDRQEFTADNLFPVNTKRIYSDYKNIHNDLNIDNNTALVIVTRGHLHDELCLQQVLFSEAKYIGMIGSRRKVTMIRKNLAIKGYGGNLFDKVYAPIGLDIGAETPLEIAVSIAAEIMKVFAGRNGSSLKLGEYYG